MKRAVLLIVGVMLIAGLTMAKKINLGYEPEGFDELAKEKGVFKTTLIRPDADFSKYTKLNPRKVMLVVRESVPESGEKETGSLIGSRSRTIVMPEFEQLARLKEIIGERNDLKEEIIPHDEMLEVKRIDTNNVEFEMKLPPTKIDDKYDLYVTILRKWRRY